MKPFGCHGRDKPGHPDAVWRGASPTRHHRHKAGDDVASGFDSFPRSLGLDGQGVQAPVEGLFQHLVHEAMTVHPALAGEGL